MRARACADGPVLPQNTGFDEDPLSPQSALAVAKARRLIWTSARPLALPCQQTWDVGFGVRGGDCSASDPAAGAAQLHLPSAPAVVWVQSLHT